MLRFLTAGESHGKGLVAIIEGLPAGLGLSEDDINRDLERRQKGFGRGGRMKIERDRAEILSGVRHGLTLGSPLALLIRNRDWENWEQRMAVEARSTGAGAGGAGDTGDTGGGSPDVEAVVCPRPGHADLVGAIKYGHHDMRNVLERASARETAARVACGAVAKKLLAEFSVDLVGHVVRIGKVEAQPVNAQLVKAWPVEVRPVEVRPVEARPGGLRQLAELAENSPVRCADPEASEDMVQEISACAGERDTLGGVVEVIAAGLPVGLGSYAYWDRRLDARLAMAAMSVPGVKGVEIGLGFGAARRRGSEVHDAIFYDGDGRRFFRKTNNAGGLEGGVTTGEPLVVRAAMKPIATIGTPLASVNILTKESAAAHHERSDVCAVPACAVVAEAVVAFELAATFAEAFGHDTLARMRQAYEAYLEYVRSF